jgi:hypothetical protein
MAQYGNRKLAKNSFAEYEAANNSHIIFAQITEQILLPPNSQQPNTIPEDSTEPRILKMDS